MKGNCNIFALQKKLMKISLFCHSACSLILFIMIFITFKKRIKIVFFFKDENGRIRRNFGDINSLNFIGLFANNIEKQY